MERKSFLKSLLVLVAAPKIVKDIDFKKAELIRQYPLDTIEVNGSCLFNDLNLLMPHYIKDLHEKYGCENYQKTIDILDIYD